MRVLWQAGELVPIAKRFQSCMDINSDNGPIAWPAMNIDVKTLTQVYQHMRAALSTLPNEGNEGNESADLSGDMNPIC